MSSKATVTSSASTSPSYPPSSIAHAGPIKHSEIPLHHRIRTTKATMPTETNAIPSDFTPGETYHDLAYQFSFFYHSREYNYEMAFNQKFVFEELEYEAHLTITGGCFDLAHHETFRSQGTCHTQDDAEADVFFQAITWFKCAFRDVQSMMTPEQIKNYLSLRAKITEARFECVALSSSTSYRQSIQFITTARAQQYLQDKYFANDQFRPTDPTYIRGMKRVRFEKPDTLNEDNSSQAESDSESENERRKKSRKTYLDTPAELSFPTMRDRFTLRPKHPALTTQHALSLPVRRR